MLSKCGDLVSSAANLNGEAISRRKTAHRHVTCAHGCWQDAATAKLYTLEVGRTAAEMQECDSRGRFHACLFGCVCLYLCALAMSEQ